MNVLLVYPRYPDTFCSFKHSLKFIAKKAAHPPLVLTVAALLPAGWEKKLIDMNVEELTNEHLAWADMVFLGAMILQEASARDVIGWCRAPGKKIVAGGPLFTTRHEDFGGVDHFILNEAESTLPPFLEDLAAGRAKPLYTSLARNLASLRPPDPDVQALGRNADPPGHFLQTRCLKYTGRGAGTSTREGCPGEVVLH